MGKDLTVEAFKRYVSVFRWTRRISEVHWHHTYKPGVAEWRAMGGAATVFSMREYHMRPQIEGGRGFSDIAQHVSITPDGLIWLGRDFNRRPASASGHNGSLERGPFMFEMVGDARKDKELHLMKKSIETAVAVTAIIQEYHSLDVTAFKFHKEMDATECPGDINKDEMIEAVSEYRNINYEPEGMTNHNRGTWVGNSILSLGAVSSGVKTLQEALNAWLKKETNSRGIKLIEDGVFGPETHTRVLVFQREHNLVDDGIVGPQTWEKLYDYM